MTGFAVDIVLLPPAEVTEAAEAISLALADATGDSSILLNPENCIPHISLAMGCVSESALDPLGEALRSLACSSLPVRIRSEGASSVMTGSGDCVSGIDITPERALLDIHEKALSAMAPFRCQEATGMLLLLPGEEEDPPAYTYIQDYPECHAHERYSPHITLGQGAVEDIVYEIQIPEEFTCTEIAICHLGNHCICRRVIQRAL